MIISINFIILYNNLIDNFGMDKLQNFKYSCIIDLCKLIQLSITGAPTLCVWIVPLFIFFSFVSAQILQV